MRLADRPYRLNAMSLFVGLCLALAQGCGMRSTLTEDQTGHPLKVADGEEVEEELVECGAGVMPCQLDNLNGATCDSLGFPGGELYCDPMTCLYDTSACEGGGDGDMGGDGDTGGMGGDGDTGGMGGGGGGTSGGFGGGNNGGNGGGFFGGGNNGDGDANPQ